MTGGREGQGGMDPSPIIPAARSSSGSSRPPPPPHRRGMRSRGVVVDVSSDGMRVAMRYVDDRDDDDHDDDDAGHVVHCDASWLRANDPRRVMLPSGQRTMDGGGGIHGGGIIVGAAIELLEATRPCDDDIDDVDDVVECRASSSSTVEESKIRVVPGPTPGDSCHPLAVYGGHPSWMRAANAKTKTKTETNANEDDDVDDGRGNARHYLVVEWATSTTMTSTTTTIYDVEWLMRFRNDTTSMARRRRRTEIRPIHAIRAFRTAIRHRCESSSGREDEEENDEREEEYEELGDELVGCATMPRGDDGLVRVDYRSIVGEKVDGTIAATTISSHSHNDGVFALLHSVFRDGAAVVTNVPTPPSHESSDEDGDDHYPVAKVAMATTYGGRLSHGALYGDVFHVRAERDAINAAYTSDGLAMHQDLAYYESPPGFQYLHCVSNGPGVLGGESTLIDGMAAAYRLRELRPRSFETLVRCPATFVKQRDGACMTYRRPHIVLADDVMEKEEEEDVMGRGERSSRSSYLDRQIVAVNWSPPFEGPVLLPPWRVDRYYESYADFDRMLNSIVDDEDSGDLSHDDDLSQYAREFTWERKLRPGEMLVFNNRRMLHGRRKFCAIEGASIEDSRRHLVGCYTNIDDTLNLYRLLLRERGYASTSILNVGNGTTIIP